MVLKEVYKGHDILEVPYTPPESTITAVSYVIRVATGRFKGAVISYKMTIPRCRKFIDGLKEVV